MKKIIESLRYYYWASFRRQLLDDVQEKYRSIYKGVVLDVGGRDRGRFKKPKDKVERWIFADINPVHHPDIVLDISHMPMIANESIGTIAAMEVFAHVEKIDQALDECFRTLKKDGALVFSALMTYPIIEDPTDFQRWTEAKWRLELTKHGFQIEVLETMGRYFTVLADFFLIANKSMPPFITYIGALFYPLLGLMTRLDNTRLVRNNKRLSSFTTGYFIIARK